MLRIGECNGELAWGVAQAQPQREALAASEIVRAGLSCFWPHFRAPDRPGVARGRNMRSLFPGYVFFGFAAGSWSWRIVRRQPGVARVLQAEPDKPALVPTQLLRELVGHERELAHNLSRARLALGVRVRIRDVNNPFCGLLATLIDLDDADRIAVMLDFLGGPTRVGGLMMDQIEAV